MRTILVLTAILLLPQSALAQEDILSEGGSQFSCCAGTLPVGQTFQVVDPSFSVLESFTVWQFGGISGSFEAALYGWDDGAMAPMGSALYTSAMRAGDPGDMHTFNVGSLLLNPSSMYIALLRGDRVHLGHYIDDPYAGGSMVTQNRVSGSWTVSDTWDLRFAADFSEGSPVVAVPEPGTMFLLLTGFASLAAVAFRRRDREIEKMSA